MELPLWEQHARVMALSDNARFFVLLRVIRFSDGPIVEFKGNPKLDRETQDFFVLKGVSSIIRGWN
ncbi:unnamed protein product [Notodromas monacha]|uniref:Uncharacterized protein n=1 Tax=Notodromas monacha TaxID=399045 RepID=A0A7R9BFR1_9CRUS|nr:unnamed protein product [Notodromas monacha]CAG0914609.1 unnamed protein product [Notodromas monacha]